MGEPRMRKTPGHLTLLEAALALALLGGVALFGASRAREARIRANEEAALSILRDIRRSRYSFGGIPGKVPDREHPGYRLTEESIPGLGAVHVLHAEPDAPGVSGRRHFWLEGRMVPWGDDGFKDVYSAIRFRADAPASSADSPVE